MRICNALSEVVDLRAWSVDLQLQVLLPVLRVVCNHPLAVIPKVREVVQECVVRHPSEHVNQFMIHEIQVSNVLTDKVRRVAGVRVNRLQNWLAAAQDGVFVWVIAVARHGAG